VVGIKPAMEKVDDVPTTDASLRERIEAFPLDAPTSRLTFSRRLARENGWTDEHALRVIREYRRFLYLTQVAGHVVVPSEAVDQAWHLHLTYTRSYWDDLCGGVLGAPLHHNPTTGGADEGRKFRDLYERTLASYRAHFDESVPADIWPDAAERFGESNRHQRVNLSRHWIVPKPRVGLAAVPVGLFGMAGLFFGQEFVAAVFPFNLKGQDFLGFAAGGGVILLLVAAAMRWLFKTPWGVADARKALRDPYAVAYLAGGEERCLAAALASLVHRRAIRVAAHNQEVTCAEPLGADAHPFEQALYEQIQALGKTPVSSLKGRLVVPVELIRSHLEKNELLVTGAAAFRSRFIPLMVGMVMPMIGVARIVQGISNDRPVGFLVVMTIVFALVALFGLARKPGRSVAGARALMVARRNEKKIKTLNYDDFRPEHASALPMAVGLFGIATLVPYFGPGLLPNMEHLKQSALISSPTSSGCGSGCGGDSGGSGCGGGGGCGGCGGD
jgi:uncharacterized protein (TIGR04222 family)